MPEIKNMEESKPFLKFEDIPVSTKTFIITTNIGLDIKEMFENLPVTDYVTVPKRRGRKKKVQSVDPNRNLLEGSIITLELCGNLRGTRLGKKRNKTEFFRNALTIVMFIEGKMLNFKVSANGKFQMTGCKYDKQAEKCIKYMWKYIRKYCTNYKFQKEEDEKNQYFQALFIPAMRNIDFNLGFVLDRAKLDEYFNTNTNYYSLLETSIGYTGVNIKFPVTRSITELRITELISVGKKWYKPRLVSYKKYLSNLNHKERIKKLNKELDITFLVFHSGKTICSGLCSEFARDSYYEFCNIIQQNKAKFEEKLTVE